MSVNERIPEPIPPGDWVGPYSCVCGASYADSVYGTTFDAGVSLVRSANGECGGYRSRGPVLWAMRCLKLGQWYADHRACEP